MVGWDDGTRPYFDSASPSKEEKKSVSERALERAAFLAISSTFGENMKQIAFT